MGPPGARFQGVGKTSCDSAGLGRAKGCLPTARWSERGSAKAGKISKAKVDAKSFHQIDGKLLVRLNLENRFQVTNSFTGAFQDSFNDAPSRAADIVHFWENAPANRHDHGGVALHQGRKGFFVTRSDKAIQKNSIRRLANLVRRRDSS